MLGLSHLTTSQCRKRRWRTGASLLRIGRRMRRGVWSTGVGGIVWEGIAGLASVTGGAGPCCVDPGHLAGSGFGRALDQMIAHDVPRPKVLPLVAGTIRVRLRNMVISISQIPGKVNVVGACGQRCVAVFFLLAARVRGLGS